MTRTSAVPLRARLENGNTPKITGRWEIKSETGPLKDVLLGPAESFRWMGLENAAWSSLVRDTLRKGYKFDKQLAKLPAEIEVYAAAHGWCPPDSAVYDEKLAERAWSRLLVLFKTALA